MKASFSLGLQAERRPAKSKANNRVVLKLINLIPDLAIISHNNVQDNEKLDGLRTPAAIMNISQEACRVESSGIVETWTNKRCSACQC